MSRGNDADAWKRLVLRSQPMPAWLSDDAPEADVAISSRARYARNLVGHRFPHHAEREELEAIRQEVLAAVDGMGFTVERSLTDIERDYLVGCHLLSPEFPVREPGRMLLLDPSRSVSVMVNEEDHVRLQVLTAGWSARTAALQAEHVLIALGRKLHFATCPKRGHLTASTTNMGSGVRISTMFHLIGLAHTKRLPSVVQALTTQGVFVRGLYGEATRAVGAFFQISTTEELAAEFLGAGEYVMQEERIARSSVSRTELDQSVQAAKSFAQTSRALTLADALRVLAWMRWASCAGMRETPTTRDIDGFLVGLAVRTSSDPQVAVRQRATALRSFLGL